MMNKEAVVQHPSLPLSQFKEVVWSSAAVGKRPGTVMNMENQPLPSLRGFAHGGVLCTFSNITAAAVAGIARISQLSSSMAGRRYSTSWQAVRTAHHSTYQRLPNPVCQPGSTGCCAGSS
jgi:hypothetical protein